MTKTAACLIMFAFLVSGWEKNARFEISHGGCIQASGVGKVHVKITLWEAPVVVGGNPALNETTEISLKAEILSEGAAGP